ncbi:hypothetical protein ScPMuIL_007205 [Solemya velum]
MTVVSVVLTVLAISIIGGWLFSWLMHFLALVYGKYRLHRPISPPSPEDLPGVTIIKPLTGVDPNLFTNLESFFNLKYPAFELLFSVQDESDAAIMVVQKLIDKYPTVNAKLFIGIKYVGPNGKINNMIRPYEAAKYDHIVISDSGILVQPDTLLEMVSFMKPDVGMVLAMPYCVERDGFAAMYEKVFFGTMHARNCLSAHSVGINCSTGMFCMFRKDIIEETGGLDVYGKYLAEDYFLADAITKKGYKLGLCNQPAMQNSGQVSITDIHKRLIRWGSLRRKMLPHLVLLEPISECFVQGFAISLSLSYLFDISPMVVFLLHVLVWFLSDYTLMGICENGPLPFSKFEFVSAWLLRELCTIYVMLQVQMGGAVTWRNKNYHIYWGGKVEEVRL